MMPDQALTERKEKKICNLQVTIIIGKNSVALIKLL
jgi:hypothetical protein